MADTIDPAEPAGAALAAPADRQWTDIEAARVIAYFLIRAAEKVGVVPGPLGWDDFPQRILAAAQGGKLPADDYRLVWQLALVLRD